MGRIAISKNINHVKREAKRSTLPWIFGRGGRDRALLSLAVNGPMTVRELGRAINMDSRPAWHMVERLKTSGLIVKRERPGGRKYVALNKRAPYYEPLMDLLLALERKWPVGRVDQPTYRWAMWQDDGAVTQARLDAMFHSKARSRVLLFLTAAGVSDMRTIYNLLGLNSGTALYTVDHLEKQGLVASTDVHGHRFVGLNSKFCAAAELRNFIECLLDADPTGEYRALGACAQSRMKDLTDTFSSRRHEVRCTSRPAQRRTR